MIQEPVFSDENEELKTEINQGLRMNQCQSFIINYNTSARKAEIKNLVQVSPLSP
jgi:hypothetical protein